MSFDAEILRQATAVLERARARGWRIATAESCTGGLIAGALTEIPGSSDVVDCGFVTYSNAAKSAMLGVPEAVLAAHGAVSAEVVRAMAAGARARAGVDMAVSVSGVAGPGGGSADKPVGTVWFGLATPAGVQASRQLFPGDRAAVRRATVAQALALLEAAVS